MNKESSFMYDEFSDRLLISRKKENEKVVGSLRILNLIIDFSTRKRVVNMELKKASEYLKSLKINPKILNELTNVEIMFNQCRDGYLIYFLLQTKEKTEKIPYNIYSQKPIILN